MQNSQLEQASESARYYFNIRFGGLRVFDCVGHVCVTPQHAVEEAFLIALSVGSTATRRNLSDAVVEMCGSHGDLILELPVAVAVPPQRPP